MEFFKKFTFFHGDDPTGGFVEYVDENTAKTLGLIYAHGDATYIGVDSSTTASSTGRRSVRLTSTATYTRGLFVLDLARMPGSICGTWPAYWTVGSHWPDDGEIDIIEGVNLQTANLMTLHTSKDCTINDSGFTGTLRSRDCSPLGYGCSIEATSSASYGDGFNSNGGGIYVMEWTNKYIQIFQFNHSSAPADLIGGTPNPGTWGKPVAYFAGDCNIDSHFRNNRIVLDTTFCGNWAGSVWSTSKCSHLASTCNDYVQNNPSAFNGTYWLINSFKVYSK